MFGYRDSKVFYKFGDDVLSFGFKDGGLATISMSADYLPCLE